MEGLHPTLLKGIHMNDIPIVEELLTLNKLRFDIGFVDGSFIGEPARRSMQKY